ncbi:ATP-dependent dethiobiotin synthetase BioD 1 [Thalassocella blandensis]|nr:ATP-dependent dethiobiotin synthetase BioD 1 [Thalassocella blandensis]
MPNAYFVTGTDTDVGKTLVVSAMLFKARQQGLRCMGLKPVAAGGEETAQGLQNEDAQRMRENASIELSYEEVCPVTLPDPLSPHIAAEKAGRTLDVDRIVGYCRGGMMHPHDLCLVEGAGGWRVPISPRALMSDIAKTLNLPVILVVGMRLGCLNHALLTAESVYRDGLEVAGWVSTVIDPNMAALAENLETLQKRFPFPCFGNIPYISNATPEAASAHIDIKNIVESGQA